MFQISDMEFAIEIQNPCTVLLWLYVYVHVVYITSP